MLFYFSVHKEIRFFSKNLIVIFYNMETLRKIEQVLSRFQMWEYVSL